MRSRTKVLIDISRDEERHICSGLHSIYVEMLWRTSNSGRLPQVSNLWGALRWRSSSSHCARSRKVADSFPDGFIGVFYWRNSSGRIMALVSTQFLTEMSTRDISWRVKAAGEYGRQPYHHVSIVLKSRNLILLDPSGPVQGCKGIDLPSPIKFMRNKMLAVSSTHVYPSSCSVITNLYRYVLNLFFLCRH
jgi:hypothetical protein